MQTEIKANIINSLLRITFLMSINSSSRTVAFLPIPLRLASVSAFDRPRWRSKLGATKYSITRQASRHALLKQFQDRQKTVRDLAEDVDKESVTNLRLKVARLEEACALLRQSRDLLIASHKAMLLSVGEIGGMRAWVKFFPQWDQVRRSLHEMGALPSTRVEILRGLGSGADDR